MVKVLGLEDSKQWEDIVRSFKEHDVYYLPGYVKAFELNGDGRAMLIYVEHGDTRAVNVVLKRDISDLPVFAGRLRKDEWYDLTTPYGYGGFLIEGLDRGAILEEYDRFARKSHIVSEFVRFHPMLENWKGMEELYDIVHLGSTVCIDTEDEEAIWDDLSSQNRNKIRKAVNAGQEVFWCRDPHIIRPFMEIYNATMDKDHADVYYYFTEDFYTSILNDLKDNAMWFYSVRDGVITAISIFLFCNGRMHYHLSASRYEYCQFAPTNLLLYEAAMWGCRNGYKKLHLGGGVGSKNDSLYVFKRSFNRYGCDMEFCIGKKIFNREIYEELADIRGSGISKIQENGFFPIYREK